MSVHEHKRHAHTNLKVGVITARDTGTLDTDESGRLIWMLFEGAGHQICCRLLAYFLKKK
jgi:molybdopterin biosynthesis enzyme MoaB